MFWRTLEEVLKHIPLRIPRGNVRRKRNLSGESYGPSPQLDLAGDGHSAQASLSDAIVVARQQRAKLFEPRSATSLARLWRDQGKRTEARDLFGPNYGWFTEGFDTPVLQDAQALLDQLA
jgi:hypothetical protein